MPERLADLATLWAEGQHDVCYGGKHAWHWFGKSENRPGELPCGCGAVRFRVRLCPTCGASTMEPSA